MKYSILFFSLIASLMMGCAPVLFMGAATGVTTSIAQERGLGGVISDTEIKAKIKLQLLNSYPQIIGNIDIIVHQGRVLLTGSIDTMENQIEIVSLIWKVAGVRDVLDEATLGSPEDFNTYAKDAWISARLKSKLVLDSDIQSMNYKFKTLKGVVYLIGIAQNKKELEHVVHHARHIVGVVKVISHLEIKNQENPSISRSQSFKKEHLKNNQSDISSENTAINQEAFENLKIKDDSSSEITEQEITGDEILSAPNSQSSFQD